MKLAEQFRRVLAQGLRSGQYEPWHTRGNGFIHKVKTLDEFLACLNALCDEFDPARPPRQLGQKPSEPPMWKPETFSLGVALLEVLLRHGLGIASNANGIADVIAAFAEIEAGVKPGSGKLLVYASRFRAIREIERNAIAKAAIAKREELAKEYLNARFLFDDLANEFKKKRGKPHQNFEELYDFDVGDSVGRSKFLKLAEACEKARRAALVNKDFSSAAEKLTRAFEAFQLYVRRELQEPADMFRLLKWAREPGEATYQSIKGGGREKIETKASESASAFFSSVKEELYLEIASYGLHQVARQVWRYETALQAVHRLRMMGTNANWQTAWKSGATGFAGNDARFVYGPFINQNSFEAANLFRARLLAVQAIPAKFFELQNKRRCMEALAERKGLKLVDEQKLATMSVRIKSLMESDPIAVSARSCRVQSSTNFYGNWRIGHGYPRSFSIFWIDVERDGTVRVYIEFDRHQGFVFSTIPNNALGDLVKAAQYADIGESYEALKALAAAYLMVLGFALDIVTAGIAGTTLRGVVLHFLAEQIAQKVVREGLVLADLDHPLLEFVAGAIVGSRFGKPRKLLSLEEIEEVERTAIRGVTRPSRAAPRKSAKEALDTGPPKEDKGLPDISGQEVGRNFYKHSEHVYSFDELPHAYRDLPQTKKDQLIADQLAEFADEEEGLLDRLTEYSNRMFRSEDVPAGTVPAMAGASSGGGRGAPSGLMARLVGATKSSGGSKAPKGGGKGATHVPSPKQNKFSNSRLFKRLDEYDEFMELDMKNTLRSERTLILQELGPPANISLKDARKRMRNVINKAKEGFGELQGEMVARSNFKVTSSVEIPVRGDEGAPMLDWVGRVAGAKLKFILVEAKGGAKTRLGKISRKVYHFVGGRLAIKSASIKKDVKQASGEWYYQKCAEIFISGQKVEATNAAEALARKNLAIELFHAAEQGKVGSIITKFGMDDESITVNTDEVVKYFATKKGGWDWTKGFPV